MKIVIELDDKDLHKAVSEQIGKQVSAVSSEIIMGKVHDILSMKFGRISDAVVDKFVAAAAADAVRTVLSRGYNDSAIKEALSAAALKLMKERTS